MSRSGYSEDFDDYWQLILWRGAVASAIRGKRGQAFLKEMLAAMDALAERKLIAHELEMDGAVCALGAVGKARGLDMKKIDPDEKDMVACAFGIAGALAAEIAFMNDEGVGYWVNEAPEARFARMRRWVESQIKPERPPNKRAANVDDKGRKAE
jgi:hypothetical protein